MLGHIYADNQLPYTKDADAWEPSVDDQGGVLQCPQGTHADNNFQCPSPGKWALTLVGCSRADN